MQRALRTNRLHQPMALRRVQAMSRRTRSLAALTAVAALGTTAVWYFARQDAIAVVLPRTAPPIGSPEVRAFLDRHVAFVCGREPSAIASDFIVEATTIDGTATTHSRTFVRWQPFGFRREIRSDSANEAIVHSSDGRHAWRVSSDGTSELLRDEQARLVLEAAWIDGLRYLAWSDPMHPPTLGPVQMLAMPPGIPALLKSGTPAQGVALTLPCNNELRLYFDITDGQLWGLANPAIVPQRNVRYGDWRQFGSLRLPAKRWENRGASAVVATQVDAVRFEPLSPTLFAGNPIEKLVSLAEAGAVECLPVEIPGSCYFVVPQVVVDGQAAGPALFDTGAGRTYVDPALADALGVSALSPRGATGIGGRAQGTRRWIEVLELGPFRQAQFEVTAMQMPLTVQGTDGRMPGLVLGGELLALSPVLDLRRGRLFFRGAPVEPLAGDNTFTVPLSRERFGDVATLAIDIDGRRIEAVLDSGMAVPLRLTAKGLLQAGLPADAATWRARGAVTLSSAGAGGQGTNDLLVRLDSFRIGPLEIERPWTMLALGKEGPGNFYEAAVGAGALAGCARIGIDCEQNLLELEPGTSLVHEGNGWRLPPAGDFLGLRLHAPDPAARANGMNLPIVVEVTPGTPAASAGIAPGDRIVAIDGVGCAGQASRQWNEKLWAHGKVIAMDVQKRDGQLLSVRLP